MLNIKHIGIYIYILYIHALITNTNYYNTNIILLYYTKLYLHYLIIDLFLLQFLFQFLLNHTLHVDK